MCKGSDGRNYKQLVKGKDDLRQDAVMQQLFEAVDTLLCADSDARQRRVCLEQRMFYIIN